MESNYRTQLTIRIPKDIYEMLVEIQKNIYPGLSLNQVVILIIKKYLNNKKEGVDINVLKCLNC